MNDPNTVVGIFTPQSTLYVGNIDWSIKKQPLRRALYLMFSRHGKILDVVVRRTPGLRGQAWIIFEDVVSATAALRAENGFCFFGKDLKVQYAKETSDVIARRDGTYIPKAKRQKLAQEQAEKAKAKTQLAAATTSNGGKESKADENDDTTTTEENGEPQSKRLKGSTNEEATATSSSNDKVAPPSNILFAQNLPKECNSSMLSLLFRQYAGFIECRIPREGIAFIEFSNEPQATLAKTNLDGFQLTTDVVLHLEYSKK